MYSSRVTGHNAYTSTGLNVPHAHHSVTRSSKNVPGVWMKFNALARNIRIFSSTTRFAQAFSYNNLHQRLTNDQRICAMDRYGHNSTISPFYHKMQWQSKNHKVQNQHPKWDNCGPYNILSL